MSKGLNLSSEAYERIRRLLEAEAKSDGAARQDLHEFERFVRETPEPCSCSELPAACDECTVDLLYDEAVCRRCFDHASGDA